MRVQPLLSATVFLYLNFVLCASAFAYLDAGSGSMLVQLILGGIAGLAVFLKLSWKWILARFGIKKDN